MIYQEMCRFFQPDDSELQRFLHIYTPNQFGGGEAADLLLSSMPGGRGARAEARSTLCLIRGAFQRAFKLAV